MKFLNFITFILVLIGALNWGLIGGFEFNLVTAIFGNKAELINLTYNLIGTAALYQTYKYLVK